MSEKLGNKWGEMMKNKYSKQTTEELTRIYLELKTKRFQKGKILSIKEGIDYFLIRKELRKRGIWEVM